MGIAAVNEDVALFNGAAGVIGINPLPAGLPVIALAGRGQASRDGEHAAGPRGRLPGSSAAFAQLLSGMERSGGDTAGSEAARSLRA